MKIVYFVHCYPPAKGGVEFLSGEIVTLLRRLGHDVHVITGKGLTLDSYKTFDNFVDESNDPDYVHRLPLKRKVQRWANKFLNKLIFISGTFSPWYFGPILYYSKKEKQIIESADVIFGAGMPTKMFYDSYWFANKYKKRLVLHPSFHDVSYYKRSFFFQKALNYSDSIIMQTDQEIINLCRSYKVSASKISQLAYCPYNEEEIDNTKATIPKNIFLSQDKLTIGFVGQITLRKNYNYFLRFLKWVEVHDPELFSLVHILIAGVRTNTSSKVEDIFYEYRNKVDFIYNFKDKDLVFNKIDVFVNPSIEESLGIVNFESIWFKKPLIVNSDSAFASLYKSDTPLLTYKTESDLYQHIKYLVNHNLAELIDKQLHFLKQYSIESYQESLRRIFSDKSN